MVVDKHKEETIKWLDDSINKLKSFKAFAEEGSIKITDGYFEDNIQAPQRMIEVENNITLSIDFIETPGSKSFD